MATAEQILTEVRDLITDPVYDATGNPQVSLDGNFVRAQSLIRFLNSGQALLGVALKGLLDWTAAASILSQDVYALDPRFFVPPTLVYFDGLTCQGPPMVSEDMLAAKNLVTGSAIGWSVHRTVPIIELRLWPAAGRTAGDSFLNAAIGPADTTLTIVNAANFGASGGPNYGWLALENNELVRYQALNTTTGVVTGVTRGQGGTKAVAHATGARVREANIWIKGLRLPTPVALPLAGTSGFGQATVLSDPGWQPGSYALAPTDPLELPDYCTPLLVDYCVHRVRYKEQDDSGARQLLQQFQTMTDKILPKRKPRMGQARTAGEGPQLWWGRTIIP